MSGLFHCALASHMLLTLATLLFLFPLFAFLYLLLFPLIVFLFITQQLAVFHVRFLL